MNNYGYASNFIMGQVKRLNSYNYKYDDSLYNLINRDPEYVIKTLVYTATGYFGPQAKYEAIMCMLDGPRFFPSHIYIPVRKAISDNFMYIVDNDFYNIFCNNLNNIIHPGVDDVDKMLASMNFDNSYNAYDATALETTKFILGFLRSIHYDLMQIYTSKFIIDDDILINYIFEDLYYETSDVTLQEHQLDPIQYIEFSTILINVVTSDDPDVHRCIETAIQSHLGAIYEKHSGISFYNEPFRNLIEYKVFQFMIDLIYDLFENVMEYLMITPNLQEIPMVYFEQHKLNVGKALRILTLPITETGVYHVM